MDFDALLEDFCSILRKLRNDMMDIPNSPSNQQKAQYSDWISSVVANVHEQFNQSNPSLIAPPNQKSTDLVVELFGISTLTAILSCTSIWNSGTEKQNDVTSSKLADMFIKKMKTDNGSVDDLNSDGLLHVNPNYTRSLLEVFASEFFNICPRSLSDKISVSLRGFIKKYASEFPHLSHFILTNSFYSLFLAKYNTARKKGLGMIYTPEVIVNFMVSAVDSLLTSKFDIKEGILNSEVQYIDPSAGSLAFPLGIFEKAVQKFQKKEIDKEKQQKSLQAWLKKLFLRPKETESHCLMFDIEILPLLIGQFRFFTKLKTQGIEIPPELLDAFNKSIHLQNALALLEEHSIFNPEKIKTAEPLVCITNPPYNVSSNNQFPFLNTLLKDYTEKSALEREPGKPKIKPIRGLSSTQDDYWKFMRFGQYLLEQRPGILAFITNNFYIDGLAARGLRKSYRKTFDEIWIVNLHGDWKKNGSNNDQQDSKDENVFDVNCGIAIIFAVRYSAALHELHKHSNPYACEVKYYELKGPSQSKLAFLSEHSIESIPFRVVGENLDWEFKPINNDYSDKYKEYQNFPYLCEIFVKTINGIKTGHDHELMGFDKQEVENKIKALYEKYGTNPPNLPRISWNPIKILKADFSQSLQKIIEWNWRGFDKRWICFDPLLMQSHRYSIMQYLLPHQKNVCLIVNRQSRGKAIGKASSYFITTTIFDNMCNEGASGLHSHAFPLRINLSNAVDDFDNPKPAIHSNLNPNFMKTLPYWKWSELTDQQKEVCAETLFYYIYAILYCPSYRNTYREWLGREFPRIPLPNSYDALESLSRLGKTLAEIQLLLDNTAQNVERIQTNMMRFQNEAIRIEKFGWIPASDNKSDTGTICFNTRIDKAKQILADDKSFCVYRIPKAVWDFEIGGIPQLAQWLDSRRYQKLGRALTVDEINEFLKIINAIEQTLQLMLKIDIEYKKMTYISHEKV